MTDYVFIKNLCILRLIISIAEKICCLVILIKKQNLYYVITHLHNYYIFIMDFNFFFSIDEIKFLHCWLSIH